MSRSSNIEIIAPQRHKEGSLDIAVSMFKIVRSTSFVEDARALHLDPKQIVIKSETFGESKLPLRRRHGIKVEVACRHEDPAGDGRLDICVNDIDSINSLNIYEKPRQIAVGGELVDIPGPSITLLLKNNLVHIYHGSNIVLSPEQAQIVSKLMGFGLQHLLEIISQENYSLHQN